MKTIFGSSLLSFDFNDSCFIYYLYSVMYPGWCPAQFPYRTVFMSCNSNTADGTSAAGTAYPGFLRGSCCSIFGFWICGSLLLFYVSFH